MGYNALGTTIIPSMYLLKAVRCKFHCDINSERSSQDNLVHHVIVCIVIDQNAKTCILSGYYL